MSIFENGKVYEKLGVRPFINVAGALTFYGGFIPSPTVAKAMEEANNRACHISELLDRSGEMIAEILGVEAAYITTGGIAGLVLSAAGLLSGNDSELRRRLPNTEGLRNEFVVQGSNKSAERAYELAGGRIVYAGQDDHCTYDQVLESIGPKTVALAEYFIDPANIGEQMPQVLPVEKMAEIAHSNNLPLILDGSANCRPTDLFLKLAQSGDLVSFGGKYFGGPSATGFVCGKKDLVDLVKLHGPTSIEPENFMTFGRGYKLDRMQIVALVVALEEWFSMDHDQRLEQERKQLTVIENRLRNIEGVTTKQVSGTGYTDLSLVIVVGPTANKTAEQAITELENGYPSIVALPAPIGRWKPAPNEGSIQVRPHCMVTGEEIIVAERLRNVLSS